MAVVHRSEATPDKNIARREPLGEVLRLMEQWPTARLQRDGLRLLWSPVAAYSSGAAQSGLGVRCCEHL